MSAMEKRRADWQCGRLADNVPGHIPVQHKIVRTQPRTDNTLNPLLQNADWDKGHLMRRAGSPRRARTGNRGPTRKIAQKNALISLFLRGEGRPSAHKPAIPEITRDHFPLNVKFRVTIYPCFGKLLGAPLNDSRNFKRPLGVFCEALCDHFAGSRSHKVEHFVPLESPSPGPEKMRPCRRGQSRISADLFRGAQSDPVEPAPAGFAANRMQKEQREQAIQRAQLSRFEIDTGASRAPVPKPKHLRQPVRPGNSPNTHGKLPFLRPSSQSSIYEKVGVPHIPDPTPALEFPSSHERRQRMLAVAKAMLESAAP